MSTKILLLQQNEGVRRARSLVFGGAYFHSLQLGGESEVHDYLNREGVDLILNDCRGAEGKGLEWVEGLRKEQPKAKVVLLTEAMDLPMVIKSIRLGVKDVFAGPLDLSIISKRLGEIAGGGDAAGEALRKADWSAFQDFFQGASSASSGKVAPPSSSRRTAPRAGDDSEALQAERRQLGEESKKIKEQLEELDKRRAEVTKAEQRIRESNTTPTRAPTGDEVSLRRERESLRMQVLELESERDLLQKSLGEKEEALRIAEASIALLKSGQSSNAAQQTPPPFAFTTPPADTGALTAAQQEAAQARLRLAEIENTLREHEAQVSTAQAESARWREQLAQCEKERDQARDFLHAKEKALANATSTLQRLQAEVTDYERRLRESQTASQAGQTASEFARQEREQRLSQLASLEAERDFLRGQISAMETELSATRDTVDRLQREAMEFGTRLQEASRLAAGGDEALRQEREQLLAKVARLESERNLAREQFAAKDKALAEAQTTVQKLRHELVQASQRARERETSSLGSTGPELGLQRDLATAMEKLGMVELERDQARDQLSAKEAALDIANTTVESLRGEVEHYLEKLRTQPAGPTSTVTDEALRTERDQLRARLSKAERDRDQARELLSAKERALSEATEALKRLRVEGDISTARTLDQTSRREAELAEAEQRLLRTQAELQAAQEKVDDAWSHLQAEQERISARKRELDEHAVAVANRERLLALERAKHAPATGAEEVGASERRLRLLRSELASLAAALNARETSLRTQEMRVEQLLTKADTDLRTVAAKESLLQNRSSEIEQRIAVAEARAAEIIAVAQARAEAEERANSGLSEALRKEREAVRKAEARYLAACHEVGEQLQALADREAAMRKREFQLDERESTIRDVLQRVLTDANALVRGDTPRDVFAGSSNEVSGAGAALSACDEARSELETQKRAFSKKAKRITELVSEIDQDPPRSV